MGCELEMSCELDKPADTPNSSCDTGEAIAETSATPKTVLQCVFIKLDTAVSCGTVSVVALDCAGMAVGGAVGDDGAWVLLDCGAACKVLNRASTVLVSIVLAKCEGAAWVSSAIVSWKGAGNTPSLWVTSGSNKSAPSSEYEVLPESQSAWELVAGSG